METVTISLIQVNQVQQFVNVVSTLTFSKIFSCKTNQSMV